MTAARDPLREAEMREAFEKNYGKTDVFVWQRDGDGYLVQAINDAWRVWRAAWTQATRRASAREATNPFSIKATLAPNPFRPPGEFLADVKIGHPALEKVRKAIDLTATDTLASIGYRDRVIWYASSSWSGHVDITIGDLEDIVTAAIDGAAAAAAPEEKENP